MAAIKSINFLPQVFRTDTNQKFLNATIDQLVTPPDLRKINAYVGRTVAPTYKSTDNYQPEPTARRQQYQLEPGAVVKDAQGNLEFFSSYIDLLQQIEHYGGNTTNHSRMFTGESYSFDGLFDFDKFVNFNQYYWLDNGPDQVEVFGSQISKSETYTVTRNTTTGAYYFTGQGQSANPTLRLAHGGTYKFIVNQPGHPFWIQTEPGTSGLKANRANTSSRDIYGVINNGIDVGEITFKVPLPDAQDFFVRMVTATNPLITVDLSTDLDYAQLQGQLLSQVIGTYDGIDSVRSQLNNKTIIFVNSSIDDIQWTTPDVFATSALTQYNTLFSSLFGTGLVVPRDIRRNVWKIQLVADGNGDYTFVLVPSTQVITNQKVYVQGGSSRGELSFYINNDTGLYTQIPDLTSILPAVYYQDGVTSSFVGQISLLDVTDSKINVDIDIVGRQEYTSPNGVVFTNGLKIQFDTTANPSTYAGNSYYVEGVGTGITLIPVDKFITPEPIYSTRGNSNPDYVTINRASQDLNPWTRSNRWFHIDVIKAAALYNNTIPLFNQTQRASRPIIEFEANLQLHNFGRLAKRPVDILDFDVLDARSTIELMDATSAMLQGVPLVQDTRIIFASDTDPTVRNQVFVVDVISLIDANTGNQVFKINLVPADDSSVNTYNNIIVTKGTNKGVQYWYDGYRWVVGQQKTLGADGLVVDPLFNVVDTKTGTAPTGFVGTKIFSYTRGTGTADSVLGFPLSYRNFNQIGDIQFTNNIETEGLGNKLLRQNTGLTAYNLRNVWRKNVEKTRQNQIISHTFNGRNVFFEIDITAATESTIPYFRVYINSLQTTYYSIKTVGVKTFVQILTYSSSNPDGPVLTKGDRIDILVYSDSVSKLGYYEIPQNLDLNTENVNFSSLTLGQLRNHLVTMTNNSNRVSGVVPGDSNLRDLQVKGQGGSIIQHASPVIYSELFLVDPEVNFVKGLELASHEYGKIKNKILETASKLSSIDLTNIPGIVDNILKNINAVKNKTFPWYYSDMVPYGDIKNTITYTVINAEIRDYEISSIFSSTTLSNTAVLIYVNNKQLVKDVDYVFDTTRAGITINSAYPLLAGDTIIINEYSNTDGNYIPETPTKLGLYPKFTPSRFVDTTYQTPVEVIQGHDGSITPVFGDFRDDVLLEFELRIYNNIKVDYAKNVFDLYNFLPGKFRKTDYVRAEFDRLLTKSFLRWVGGNRVDFTNNTYFEAGNPWTWNYKRFFDTVNGQRLPGAWRAIFKFFFDTDRPHTHPWEMLGFTVQPDWWQDRYGPAPYTGGNGVLWTDLEKGYIYSGDRAGIDSRFARPGLSKILPVDEYGLLRSPEQFLVKNFNSNQANGSFGVGDQGPVETAWRRSSDYAYAVQRAIALSHPAFYFGTLMNVGRYYKNTDLDQYVLSDTLQRITPAAFTINGPNARVAGYTNWVAEYLRSQGVDPDTKINNYLSKLKVQLAYKMAGYSDKTLVEVVAEQSSPTSTNQGVVLPNESYSINLHKSTPTTNVTYSAVIVEKSENGYTVSGYDVDNPYFTIIPSLANNQAYTITSGNSRAVIYKDYQKYKVTVPYGHEFNNKQQVVDFLISYERHLRARGITMTEMDTDLQIQRDFKLSVREFLGWSEQGWAPGNILVLSPVLNRLVVNTKSGVVDAIENRPGATRILDINFNVIKNTQFSVVRSDNRFSVEANLGQTIALAVFNIVEYEHVMIFDNVTVFNDIVYKPELGNRQYRLKLIGSKTGSWTGNLNPPGFIYNSPRVADWVSGTDYAKGSLVIYKDLYYAATSDLSATIEFKPSQWRQIPSSEIKTGLLPNFSYNAEKFKRFNDPDNLEVEGNFDRYSLGLIGFRPRQYLTDFGIDTQTQVKFYQGFIKEKGTLNAIKAFTAAGFNGVTSTINMYEEWAMRVGEYGALDNNKNVEVVLNEGLFNSDPVTFTLLPNNGVATDRVIGVTPDKLYKTSPGYQPNIYKNRDAKSVVNNDIPSAGYVYLDDVDTTIFDTGNYASLNQHLDVMKSGYKIWSAKATLGDWNVFRVTDIGNQIKQLDYTIDIVGTATLARTHNLGYGDLLVIKGFDPRVDGVYQVYNVVDAFRVEIVLYQNFEAIRQAKTITGLAPIYHLQSVRLTQPTDINTITPATGWHDSDKIWVDDAGNGQWAVFNKSTPWSANLSPFNPSMQLGNGYASYSGFGTVSAINNTGTFAAAGMPNLNRGNVVVFVANTANHNTLTAVANLGATHSSVSLYGASLDTAGNLLYVGNPGDGSTEAGRVHIYSYNGNTTMQWRQSITHSTTGDKFGSSISASADGEWLMVGAPFAGNVYVYQANTSGYYNLANTIVGNITANFGLTIKTTTDASQTIISAPYEQINGVAGAGAVYVYDRSIETFRANGNVYITQYPVSTETPVTVNGIINTNWTAPNANAIVFTVNNVPAYGSIINIESSKFQLLEKITADTPTSGAMFGIAAHISGNDADVYISSPGYSEPGYHSGVVYRYTNQGAAYGTITSTVYSPTVTVGDSVRINGRKITFTGTTVANVVADINSANISGVSAAIDFANVLTITSNVSTSYSRLVITPGPGTALRDLGLSVYSLGQTLKHPARDQVDQFGSQVISSADGRTLVIGASGGTTYNGTTFDNITTLFENGSTTFYGAIAGSGVAYVYGLVGSALTGTELDQYVLVQQLENTSLSTNDEFGAGMSMNAQTLLVGAPGDSGNYQFYGNGQLVQDANGRAVPIRNAGTYYTYNNFSGNVGWDVIRHQEPKVDIDSVTRMFVYNANTQVILTNLDFIDPAKGKILGAAEQDIDYKTNYDPAVYNSATGIDNYTMDVSVSTDYHWGATQVGKTWWNLDSVRYIDYEQGNLTYRSTHWGRPFPGSIVEVCEWVESAVPPSEYTGDGVPKYPNDEAFNVESYIDTSTKLVRSRYYFWVKDRTTVDTDKTNRLNTVSTIQDMILNPQAQAIPYAAVLRSDTVSLHGVTDMLTGNSIVLNMHYDTIRNTNIIHSEYQLVQEGNSNSLVPTRIVNKIKDSLAGIDAQNNPVPDPALPIQSRIGIDVRPRQTVFVNRLAAVKNFVEFCNNVFVTVPIVEEFNIQNLYSAEAVPTTGFDYTVNTKLELGYVDLTGRAGQYFLVINDESQSNLWTIYLYNGSTFALTRKQSYYTPFYWSTIDWYDSTYDPTVKPDYVVATTKDLQKYKFAAGKVAKVLNNGRGQFEVYRYTSATAKTLVGIENGTIQFNSNLYADGAANSTEMRIILDTLEQYIFIDTLKDKFNSLVFYMINYVLTEQPSLDWAVKTSFVSVLHQLRKLEQFPNYIKDNQTYYVNYIDEVKPYRTSLREYLLDYQGTDVFGGDVTDFDLPAAYDARSKTYRSPDGTKTYDSTTLSNNLAYREWNLNHKHGIRDVIVSNAGIGYYLEPAVTVIGGGGTGANVQAIVDLSTRTIKEFVVVKPGTGYTSTPSIFINGVGTGAIGTARLANEYYNETEVIQELTLSSNVTVYTANLIIQPNTNVEGSSYTNV